MHLGKSRTQKATWIKTLTLFRTQIIYLLAFCTETKPMLDNAYPDLHMLPHMLMYKKQ